MLWRFARWILFALGGLIAFVAIWIVTHLADPPIDDSDLRLQRPVVADDENGMALLERASVEAWWPEEKVQRLADLLDGKLVDPALEREVLAKNASVLAQVPAILAAPVFVVPSLALSDELDRGLSWQRVSRLLAIRAGHRARAGDAEGALADSIAAARLGARIQSGPGAALFEAGFGVGMQKIGLRALGRVLAEIELDVRQSRALDGNLTALRVEPAAWRSLWAYEYDTRARSLVAYAEASDTGEEPWLLRLVPNRYLFKPNATRALFAEAYRTYGAQGAVPCSLATWPVSKPSRRQQARAVLGPNSVGHILTWIAIPGWDDLALRRCEQDARVEAARAWVALRAYQRDHRALPARLEELSPEYLAEVPKDPFDGVTLRYDPERRLLWSIGSDFTDHGGEGDEHAEPAFPLPF